MKQQEFIDSIQPTIEKMDKADSLFFMFFSKEEDQFTAQIHNMDFGDLLIVMNSIVTRLELNPPAMEALIQSLIQNWQKAYNEKADAARQTKSPIEVIKR